MHTIVIEGASGYGGMELSRILARHAGVEIVGLSSSRWAGRPVHEILGLPGPVGALRYEKTLDQSADLAFLATPADASARLAPQWLERGARVIDLSNAYRASDDAVYGLTEFAREQLSDARLVANPGCYPTATQLALLPLINQNMLASEPIHVDAKSGATGAGRKVDETLLFNELVDNHYPYRVGQHQHVPELERGLGRDVLFTPHLLPIQRGLLVTAYVKVNPGITADNLLDCLKERYQNEPFVQVVEPGADLGVRRVLSTPLCRVGVAPVIKSSWARVFGSIDNLMKGAASQAVQNMNLMFGYSETDGLLP